MTWKCNAGGTCAKTLNATGYVPHCCGQPMIMIQLVFIR